MAAAAAAANASYSSSYSCSGSDSSSDVRSSSSSSSSSRRHSSSRSRVASRPPQLAQLVQPPQHVQQSTNPVPPAHAAHAVPAAPDAHLQGGQTAANAPGTSTMEDLKRRRAQRILDIAVQGARPVSAASFSVMAPQARAKPTPKANVSGDSNTARATATGLQVASTTSSSSSSSFARPVTQAAPPADRQVVVPAAVQAQAALPTTGSVYSSLSLADLQCLAKGMDIHVEGIESHAGLVEKIVNHKARATRNPAQTPEPEPQDNVEQPSADGRGENSQRAASTQRRATSRRRAAAAAAVLAAVPASARAAAAAAASTAVPPGDKGDAPRNTGSSPPHATGSYPATAKGLKRALGGIKSSQYTIAQFIDRIWEASPQLWCTRSALVAEYPDVEQVEMYSDPALPLGLLRSYALNGQRLAYNKKGYIVFRANGVQYPAETPCPIAKKANNFEDCYNLVSLWLLVALREKYLEKTAAPNFFAKYKGATNIVEDHCKMLLEYLYMDIPKAIGFEVQVLDSWKRARPLWMPRPPNTTPLEFTRKAARCLGWAAEQSAPSSTQHPDDSKRGRADLSAQPPKKRSRTTQDDDVRMRSKKGDKSKAAASARSSDDKSSSSSSSSSSSRSSSSDSNGNAISDTSRCPLENNARGQAKKATELAKTPKIAAPSEAGRPTNEPPAKEGPKVIVTRAEDYKHQVRAFWVRKDPRPPAPPPPAAPAAAAAAASGRKPGLDHEVGSRSSGFGYGYGSRFNVDEDGESEEEEEEEEGEEEEEQEEDEEEEEEYNKRDSEGHDAGARPEAGKVPLQQQPRTKTVSDASRRYLNTALTGAERHNKKKAEVEASAKSRAAEKKRVLDKRAEKRKAAAEAAADPLRLAGHPPEEDLDVDNVDVDKVADKQANNEGSTVNVNDSGEDNPANAGPGGGTQAQNQNQDQDKSLKHLADPPQQARARLVLMPKRPENNKEDEEESEEVSEEESEEEDEEENVEVEVVVEIEVVGGKNESQEQHHEQHQEQQQEQQQEQNLEKVSEQNGDQQQEHQVPTERATESETQKPTPTDAEDEESEFQPKPTPGPGPGPGPDPQPLESTNLNSSTAVAADDDPHDPLQAEV